MSHHTLTNILNTQSRQIYFISQQIKHAENASQECGFLSAVIAVRCLTDSPVD